jgi:uncharacterized protein with FMN-binding domain
MRTTAAFISGMATAGVLATGIAWGAGIANGSTDATAQGSTDTTTNSGNGSTNTNTSGSNSGSSSNSNSSSGTDTTNTTASGATDGTYDGDTVQTRYGPMQVEVVIKGGKIDSATTLQHPGGDRTSDQINAQVVPMLNGAIVQYQTLNFGNVSRATISTNAYKQSAQSALDKAGFTG